MKQKELEKLAQSLAKNIKTESDLSNFSSQLMKMTVEAALGAEMDDHLGYPKGQKSKNKNYRNGFTKKKIKSNVGEVEISTPRDRNGDFEPILVKKRQTRLTQFDEQILSLYAKGMSTRDIVATFEEMYDGAQISPMLVSKVTKRLLNNLNNGKPVS